MLNDIVLFWLVLAGLLVVDNLVWIPAGGDHLRLGFAGRLHYSPATRFQAAQRDLVLLNPLNPFDQLLVTQACIGPLSAVALRTSARHARRARAAAHRLSWLGYIYLLALLALAVSSARLFFGWVLLTLLLIHLSMWCAALFLLLRDRSLLALGRGRVAALAIEALLVPGYLVNLGKRVWRGRSFEIPAFSVGLRQLFHMPAGEEQAFYQLRMAQRLDEIVLALDFGDHEASGAAPSALKQWTEEVQQCLKASAAQAGS